LFHFAPLHQMDLVLSLGAGSVCVLWFELLKYAWRRLATRTS
jgi:P-type Ca2+ transporter type 2C